MHEIIERRVKVSELFKKRYKHYEIAQMLGVDRSTITKDIKAIQKEWKAEALDNLHIVRLRELADLDDMERICIERLEKLAKNPHQGSRWMEERRKIKERRSKLLGLDAEQKMSVKRELTIITKEKRDQVVLAALGNRLPEGIEYNPKIGFTGDAIDVEFEEIKSSNGNSDTTHTAAA